jgi:hypothetical protein
VARLDELTHRSALDLAELIRRGDVSSSEVVAAQPDAPLSARVPGAP